MVATLTTPKSGTGESEIFVFPRLLWEQYVTIGDALPERTSLKMVYLDGSLTFLTKSHRHEWLAECFSHAVVAIAIGCDLDCETAGSTTFRRRAREAGVEGDKTFYFAPNAAQVRGPAEIDLETQPPPDLAIEVEVTHPADAAMAVWGRLGVPEFWRFDEASRTLSVWALRQDGTYSREERSRFLPMFDPHELADRIRLVEELGLTRGIARIGEWARDILAPRLRGNP